MSDLTSEVKLLREELDRIKLRNRKVESDKAWELSKTRTSFIAGSTYIVIVIFMFLIADSHPFLNAFVATFAYLLSTATYGILKKWWLKNRKQ